MLILPLAELQIQQYGVLYFFALQMLILPLAELQIQQYGGDLYFSHYKYPACPIRDIISVEIEISTQQTSRRDVICKENIYILIDNIEFFCIFAAVLINNCYGK